MESSGLPAPLRLLSSSPNQAERGQLHPPVLSLACCALHKTLAERPPCGCRGWALLAACCTMHACCAVSDTRHQRAKGKAGRAENLTSVLIRMVTPHHTFDAALRCRCPSCPACGHCLCPCGWAVSPGTRFRCVIADQRCTSPRHRALKHIYLLKCTPVVADTIIEIELADREQKVTDC